MSIQQLGEVKASPYRYGLSPFEYALGESGGSLQLAIVHAQIKWPVAPNPPYSDTLH
ncbi:serine/threonine-protein kinase 16-like [Cucumis melo var. makuwa]|uniref:Serine/threonine-protein kinase 16-like n=1 Tax=Cucumis melo var. makuwa TaxID=1194695 RepID=A0A5D3DXH0_CUCMM|nr:serine/threonine-protein kinase 16-like [Cucumis melo var. makuwa]